MTAVRPSPSGAPDVRLPCVLHVIQNSGSGGSESMFLALTRGLQAAGWPLVLATGQPGWLVEQANRLGIPAHIVPGLHRERAFDVGSVLTLRRLIRTYGCALVHAMMFPSQLYAAAAAWLARRPCIVNIRNSHYDLVGRRRRFVWRHVIAPLSSAVVTVTEQLAEEARRVTGSDRVTCIYNGVDLERFAPRGRGPATRTRLGLPADAMVVGTVGSVRSVKGHADLVRAAAIVIEKCPSLRVVLIGAETQPAAAEVRRLIRERGLTERVLLLGHREDVPELLEAVDVFCLPSHSEGMSGALLQAMAAGLPVVATAVGGSPEVVVAGETGFLVPPRDSPALADALLELAGRRGLRQQMGAAGLARARATFSTSTMLDRYLQLYRGLAAAASAPRRPARRGCER